MKTIKSLKTQFYENSEYIHFSTKTGDYKDP